MNDLELVGQGVVKLDTKKADKTELSQYALKTDIPKDQDLSGYAKKTDLDVKADKSSTYTKQEVDSKIVAKDTLETETRNILNNLIK